MPYLRTQPFPKKKAVGQAPHLPHKVMTKRGGQKGKAFQQELRFRLGLAWRQNLSLR